jgi:hypothetical protein
MLGVKKCIFSANERTMSTPGREKYSVKSKEFPFLDCTKSRSKINNKVKQSVL